MSGSLVRYEVRDRVAELTIDRPPVNALNLELIDELVAAMDRAASDDGVRAVIVASALEKAFCAGLDLDVVKGRSGQDLRRFLEKLYIGLYDVQYRLGKPSISAVRGAARAGGMTIAVSCDMVIAGEGATFGYPEVNVGLLPALHFVHLPRMAGRHRAFEHLFLGDSFTAETAASLGVVNRVVPDDRVLDEARDIARTFAEKSPVVMKMGRDAFMRTNDADYRRSIGGVVDTMAALIETKDGQEGLNAFVEKRPPDWRGE
jgi:enoyl-CoA hydratase